MQIPTQQSKAVPCLTGQTGSQHCRSTNTHKTSESLNRGCKVAIADTLATACHMCHMRRCACWNCSCARQHLATCLVISSWAHRHDAHQVVGDTLQLTEFDSLGCISKLHIKLACTRIILNDVYRLLCASTGHDHLRPVFAEIVSDSR